MCSAGGIHKLLCKVLKAGVKRGIRPCGMDDSVQTLAGWVGPVHALLHLPQEPLCIVVLALQDTGSGADTTGMRCKMRLCHNMQDSVKGCVKHHCHEKS